MLLEALDALMDTFDTSNLSLLGVRGVGASMRQIVIVTNPHLFLVHATEALQSLGHHHPVLALLVPHITFGCVLGWLSPVWLGLRRLLQ